MAEKRNVYKIQDIGGVGEVHISDEVIAMIAALAATDAEGVSLNGTNTRELRQKSSTKNLSKGVKITMEEGTVAVDLNLNLAYGQSILDTGKTVQAPSNLWVDMNNVLRGDMVRLLGETNVVYRPPEQE